MAGGAYPFVISWPPPAVAYRFLRPHELALEPREGVVLLNPWMGSRPISVRAAASIVSTWTLTHLRDNPFPRVALAPGAGVGPGAQAARMLIAPLNAQILSDAALWLALDLGGPMPPSFAAESDTPRLGLLSMLEPLARIVVSFRSALSSVALHPVTSTPAGEEAIFPLAQLGGSWLPSFLRLVCAAVLPPAVAGDDRAPRLAARAENLLCQTMAAVANAPTSLGTFRLSNVFDYKGNGPKTALISLVGEAAARVPGRYGPPPPPVTLPALEQLSVTRIAEDLGEDLPY